MWIDLGWSLEGVLKDPSPISPQKKGTIYQQNYLTLNLYFDICFLDTLILLNESMTLARAQSL